MSLAGKTALITGMSPAQHAVRRFCDRSSAMPDTEGDLLRAGSTQGIGLGMLQGLAKAGANVVMHGLLPADQAEERCQGMRSEYGVQVGHSAADVTKPPEIRQALLLCDKLLHPSQSASALAQLHNVRQALASLEIQLATGT